MCGPNDFKAATGLGIEDVVLLPPSALLQVHAKRVRETLKAAVDAAKRKKYAGMDYHNHITLLGVGADLVEKRLQRFQVPEKLSLRTAEGRSVLHALVWLQALAEVAREGQVVALKDWHRAMQGLP